MRYQPQTKQSLEDEAFNRLLPVGNYPCEVMDAEDAVSGKGNDMIHLTVRVWPDENDSGIFRDLHVYLLEAMPELLYSACEGFDLMDEYKSGELNADHFKGRTGVAKVGRQRAKPPYGPKNTINGFINDEAKPDLHVNVSGGEKVSTKKGKAGVTAAGRIIDDEIPF